MEGSIETTMTRDAVRGLALAQARDAVREFAQAYGFLDAYLCGCGRPTCINDDPERMSLVMMLRAVSSQWTSIPDPAPEALLRERLLAFARAFDLDSCPNGDPACHCAHIADGDARQVLRTVATVWHGRAGNMAPAEPGLHAPPALSAETVASLATDHAHHLAVLDALALQMVPDRSADFLRVARRAAREQGGAWLEEARAMAAETLASWMARPGDIPEVGRVRDSATAIAFRCAWTVGDAAALEGAAADACAAILIRGIAHPSITELLLAPFEGVVPIADLDALADVEALAATSP